MRTGFMAAPQTPESGHGMARVTTSDPTLRGIDLGASMLKHWMSYGLVLVAGMATAVGCGGDGGTLPTAPAFVTVDFSTCDVADRAVWLAYQDGNGAWTRVTGVANVYTFSITSGKGGVAYVSLGPGSLSSVQVQYKTQAALTARTLTFCALTPTRGKTVTGIAAGLDDASHEAYVSLGGGTTRAFFPSALNFQILGVKDGPHVLVGFRSGLGEVDRAIIRRDQNIADNGSVGTLDFAGAESFATASATITVDGVGANDPLYYDLSYHVSATCEAAPFGPLFIEGPPAGSFTAFGLPAAQQRASDYHSIHVESGSRSVTEYFHTMAARTVTLGALLPTPTVTSLGGPYQRLQAVYTLPAAYAVTAFGYDDGTKFVNLSATSGYLGGAAVTLGLADYSGLAGWDNNWAPPSTSSGHWNVSAATSPVSVCTENASFKSAVAGGMY